jgi:carbon storage regulator
MLVLTRKSGEAIQIGDHVEITVLSIQGDQIKLGINAPKHVEIHRREVYLSIQESNNEAASISQSIIEKLKTTRLDL